MHLLVTNVFFDPFSYGGATVVAEEVVRELARKTDWQITVVSVSSSLGIEPYHMVRTQGAGVDHIIISVPQLLAGADNYLNSQVETIFEQLVNSITPDVVHAHCVQNIGAGGLRAVNAQGIPLIISVHDFWWLCERQFMITGKGRYCGRERINPDLCASCVDSISSNRARDRILRDVLNNASVITYPSRFARDLHERSGIDESRGIVWPNGVRLPNPTFFERQAERRLRDPRLSFGFVGGPSQIKGWPVIKEAFKKLDRNDFIVNVVDASADRSWWRQGDFSDLPGEWRISPRYTQERLDDFYVEIDALLFLSQWKETFGLALREAAARGLDIVQTEGGGTTEYDGFGNARVVQIGDGPEKVAIELNALLEGYRNGRPGRVRGYSEQADDLIRIINNLVDF